MGQYDNNDSQQTYRHSKKVKVNGIEKPKKIGNKSNGPT